MKDRIYILLVLLLLASCRMEPYRGYTEEAYKSTPVYISVGSTKPCDVRSSGPIDAEEIWKWRDTKIYIYGFKEEVDGFGFYSTDGTGNCLVDGTAEGCPNAGRLAIINGSDDFVVWNASDDIPYYPKGFAPYGFFAYYIDDYEVEDSLIVRGRESITMPVVINGAQDIMTARASINDGQLADMDYSEHEKSILLRASYSAYSANNGVHPELFFSHELVRLSFVAYPARAEAADVTVQQVAIDSRVNGLFTVAHKDTAMIGIDFSADSEMVPLKLMEKEYDRFLDRDRYRLSWNDGDWDKSLYDRTAVELGGSLLVAPAESYICSVLIKDKDVDDVPYQFDVRNSSGQFLPGNHYVVRLAVYGRFEIEADVIMVDWEDGGTYDVDVK